MKETSSVPLQVRRYPTRLCSKTCSAAGTATSVDQPAARQPQEDVLQGAAPHQGTVGPQPAAVNGSRRRLAVGGIKQDPVRQPLDPVSQALEVAIGRRFA